MEKELLAHLEIIGQIAETWCGKTDGLVSDAFFTIAEKCRAAEQGVQSDECEACRDKSYITLGNGNVICWYCGRIRR